MLAFLGGELLPDERSTVEGHVAACSACADILTWAAADQASDTGWPGRRGHPFVGELQPGSRVGRYQILAAIGRGGMGEVYAAYHPELDRKIALKIVAGSSGDTGERRVRLLREARAIARLSHPNVVTVHDAGTFGDRVFIAMELIDGATIDDWLRGAPRTWREVVDVFLAAGRGLAAAHAADVIHRDFKPQNVMIAKDGTVRVMDFGLARLTADDTDGSRPAGDDVPTVRINKATKTGALIGTPAYMSPEQFRRETLDARSDQFSFCVALHEALFGTRPAGAAADRAGELEGPATARRIGIPGWLRAVVLRGASIERERRYPSMNALLADLDRGRTRVKRRLSVAAAGIGVLLASAGAWRVAHGNRFVCAGPEDRLTAVWSADANSSRRLAMHRAFAASGRATAETSWERLSKVLDEYVSAWGGMYVQTCEATHVRGEQSADVLDLRMSCLNDNLDQVRALTDALLASNTNALSNAVTAARDLTPVSRCADVALLRSAVPLPREEAKLREVQRLRRALADVQTLWDIGDYGGVLRRADALRSEVDRTAYKPLLGELLYYVGMAQSALDPDGLTSHATLRQAMVVAEATRDDITAAKICTSLIYVSGYRLGRVEEAEFWSGLAHAILDRRGAEDPRMRAWVDTNWASALARAGDLERARVVAERGAARKEQVLGKDHPDYAISLGQISYILGRAGHPTEALDIVGRAVEIFQAHGDPEAFLLGAAYANQGDALFALGRFSEAESAFERALQILAKSVGRKHPETAFALHGLGEVRLVQNRPADAIPYFSDALSVRQSSHTDPDPVVEADSEFGLARALWDGGGDRADARRLAGSALAIYATERQQKREQTVQVWLAIHRRHN